MGSSSCRDRIQWKQTATGGSVFGSQKENHALGSYHSHCGAAEPDPPCRERRWPSSRHDECGVAVEAT